jgi:PLP dependent protein
VNQKDRLSSIQDKIRSAAATSGRNEDAVTLVAVSKTFPLEDILSFGNLGQLDFGENKVQEFIQKSDEHRSLKNAPAIQWHLIGHLQRNKVKDIVGRAHLFHALDSVRLGKSLNRHLEEVNSSLSCLIQVNVSGEDSKFGISPSELDQFVDQMLGFDQLRLKGLMTLASPSHNSNEVRPQFAHLRALSESVSDRLTFDDFPVLSMGMSSDFEVAIEEGATIIRVGSSLFGGRTYESA